jgi:hypothetical protein
MPVPTFVRNRADYCEVHFQCIGAGENRKEIPAEWIKANWIAGFVSSMINDSDFSAEHFFPL